MGYEFRQGEKVVWAPSVAAAQCFLWQVRFLEGKCASKCGLVEESPDVFQIDYPRLLAFLGEVRAKINVSNPYLYLMLKGVCVHLLAIYLTHDAIPSTVARKYPGDWVIEAEKLCDESFKKNIGPKYN
jgi:hypothetical protein